jgi:hypothetical protein
MYRTCQREADWSSADNGNGSIGGHSDVLKATWPERVRPWGSPTALVGSDQRGLALGVGLGRRRVLQAEDAARVVVEQLLLIRR